MRKKSLNKITHLIVAGVAMAMGFLIAFAIGECVLTTIENVIK